MSQFDDETALEHTGDGLWLGHLSPAWNIGENPNGGYLVSFALNALSQSLPHPDPVSVTTHYLRPGSPGVDCEIKVDVIRTGRSISTARATLSQDGKERLVVMAAFADLGVSVGIDTDISLRPPVIPAPDDCMQRSGELQDIELGIASRLDVRLDPALARPGEVGSPEMGGWVRFKDGREPDARSLLLFADGFPPSPLGLLGEIGWVPTIELTVHVRRRPRPGFIQAHFKSDDLADGRLIESGHLWDSEGSLVAVSRQLGLVVPRG
jgi:acyl-CoA thioesterase